MKKPLARAAFLLIISKIKVKFDEPEHGWVGFIIKEDGEERVNCSASYIFNSFEQLVVALRMTLDFQIESKVIWFEEPYELEMTFARRSDRVQLEIWSYPDSNRSYHVQKTGDEVAIFRGTYEETCLPFWRALRELQGRYSEQEFRKRYKSVFPTRELDLLTEALGKSK